MKVRIGTYRCSALIMALGLVVLALPAMAQQGPQPGPQPGGFGGPGMGGPGMGPGMMGPGMMGPMGPPMPMSPPVTMMVVDGVVYIACNGTLTAYKAKTLKLLGQATYWTPPQPPGMPMGPGGNRGPQPAGPPPFAP